MASVEVDEQEIERSLRRRLTRLFEENKQFAGAVDILKTWEQDGWEVLLFGGILRDSAALKHRPTPRDIDVVICNADLSQLRQKLAPFVVRENRFGGLQLQMERWNFDVWPIASTWAFTQKSDWTPTPTNLTKTTFLNVEAATTEIRNGKPCKIFQNGLYKGVQDRQLDINFSDNPYPALAAVRAIVTASKLDYALTPRLAKYILSHAREMGESALVRAQDKHYGRVPFRDSDLLLICQDIEEQLAIARTRIDLNFPLHGEQLSLWDDYSSKLPGSVMLGEKSF